MKGYFYKYACQGMLTAVVLSITAVSMLHIFIQWRIFKTIQKATSRFVRCGNVIFPAIVFPRVFVKSNCSFLWLLLMDVTEFIQVFGFMITCVMLGFGIHGALTKDHDEDDFKHKKK